MFLPFQLRDAGRHLRHPFEAGVARAAGEDAQAARIRNRRETSTFASAKGLRRRKHCGMLEVPFRLLHIVFLI
jgi:hypothetical protein